jgi:hypothetical protein
MAHQDPVAVYNAANNVEAHLVCNALLNAGVEASVTEDVSQVGVWALGLIPEIHKPQVWVARADIERAAPVLADYERRAAELRDVRTPEQSQGGTEIEVVCEGCGKQSVFPAAQRGSVQECRHCGGFVDVEDQDSAEEWADFQGEEEAAEEP